MNDRATERIVPTQSRDYCERSNRGVLRCELDGGHDLAAERPQQEVGVPISGCRSGLRETPSGRVTAKAEAQRARFEAPQTLRQVLNRAVNWKLIDDNPPSVKGEAAQSASRGPDRDRLKQIMQRQGESLPLVARSGRG
jgi:hypothetical protein